MGYDPGPIDGKYGLKTANAIKALQRDVGVTQDGKISSLLEILKKIQKEASIKNEKSNQTGNYNETNSQSMSSQRPSVSAVRTQTIPDPNRQQKDRGMPAHSHIDYTGHRWECDNGYRQLGDECVKIKLPANAHIDYTGHRWECDNGYRQLGNECVKIDLPAHAHIDYTGHRWECDDGYKRIGNECVPLSGQ